MGQEARNLMKESNKQSVLRLKYHDRLWHKEQSVEPYGNHQSSKDEDHRTKCPAHFLEVKEQQQSRRRQQQDPERVVGKRCVKPKKQRAYRGATHPASRAGNAREVLDGAGDAQRK